MADFDACARALRKTLDELPRASSRLYWIFAKDFGLSESDLSEAVDPFLYAGHWECLWRIAPWVTDEAFGAGEFDRSSNPFLASAIEQIKEGESASVQHAASRGMKAVLENAARIESTSGWPSESASASTSLQQQEGKSTREEEFELQVISRLILRGQVTGTIAGLATILRTDALEDESVQYATFVDDIYPLFLLAYTRIRPVELLRTFLVDADRLLRNSTWAGIYGSGWQSTWALLDLPHAQPIRNRGHVVEDMLDQPLNFAGYPRFVPLPEEPA
jgi:hypothetical protein